MKRLFNASELIHLLLALLPLLLYGVLAGRLPAEVPVHWNFYGEVDDTAAPWVLVLFPIGTYVFLTVLPLISPTKIDQMSKLYFRIRVLLQLLMLFVVGLSYAVALELPVDGVRAISIAVLVFLACIGNFLLNLPRNHFIGVRTPWTLESDEVWRITHRMTAYLWVAGGAGGAVLVLLLPAAWQIPVSIISILLLALVPVLYSYLVFRRLRRAL